MAGSLLGIVLAPILGASILAIIYLVGLKGKGVPRNIVYAIGVGAPAISFVLTLVCLYLFNASNSLLHVEAYTWLHVGEFHIQMGFLGDALSLYMALFITFVGTLIHIYAGGYMWEDRGFGKFFAYFNLFMASMLLLVLADSPIVMFIGWEGVGVCSYLLISYYYDKPQNSNAGNKAFLANRIGDAGFIIGLSTLFVTLDISGFTYEAIASGVSSLSANTLSFVGIMLFIGAVGKSAQIPLYVWLPDAMAGPTPVSALIHAATMVTAGVFMVARFDFLYTLVPHVGVFIATIGAISALYAALIASRQQDIKKILAYSTMSQLGYMFMAAGVGAYDAGLFHVLTHAFFKALLFLGAGAVIVALGHEQNILRMGGLVNRLKYVHITMLIGTLAIAGIFPFAGFFSKDMILATLFAKEHYVLWIIGVVVAGMTAFYMFRLYFMVFWAPSNEKILYPLGKNMQWPLVVLAFGSICVGWIGLPHAMGGSGWIHGWFGLEGLHLNTQAEWVLMSLNTLVAVGGIGWAYYRFTQNAFLHTPPYWEAVTHAFYADSIVSKGVILPLQRLSSWIGNRVDIQGIDKGIMGACWMLIHVGKRAQFLQNGSVRNYAMMMLAGAGLFCLYMLEVL
jgi:NADH-quinone oxidoreductase subunit L